MTDAIPGIELMSALQGQAGQAMQAIQFGIQANQNKQQIAQNQQRLDMQKEQFDFQKPIMEIESKFYMAHGNDILKQKNLELTAKKSESELLLASNIIQGISDQSGYDKAKQNLSERGIDLDSVTGGRFLGGYTKKLGEGFLNDAALTTTTRAQLLQVDAQRTASMQASDYNQSLKDQAEQRKQLNPLGTDPADIFPVAGGGSIYASKGGSVIGRTLDGGYFAPTSEQIAGFNAHIAKTSAAKNSTTEKFSSAGVTESVVLPNSDNAVVQMSNLKGRSVNVSGRQINRDNWDQFGIKSESQEVTIPEAQWSSLGFIPRTTQAAETSINKKALVGNSALFDMTSAAQSALVGGGTIPGIASDISNAVEGARDQAMTMGYEVNIPNIQETIKDFDDGLDDYGVDERLKPLLTQVLLQSSIMSQEKGGVVNSTFVKETLKASGIQSALASKGGISAWLKVQQDTAGAKIVESNYALASHGGVATLDAREHPDLYLQVVDQNDLYRFMNRSQRDIFEHAKTLAGVKPTDAALKEAIEQVKSKQPDSNAPPSYLMRSK